MFVIIDSTTKLDIAHLKQFSFAAMRDIALIGPRSTPIGRRYAYIVTIGRLDRMVELFYVLAHLHEADDSGVEKWLSEAAMQVMGTEVDPLGFWPFYTKAIIDLGIQPRSTWRHEKTGNLYWLDRIVNLKGDAAGKFRPTCVYRLLDGSDGDWFARPTFEFFEKFSQL